MLLIILTLCDRIKNAKQNLIEQMQDSISSENGEVYIFICATQNVFTDLLKTRIPTKTVCVALPAFALSFVWRQSGFRVFLSAITSVVALFLFWGLFTLAREKNGLEIAKNAKKDEFYTQYEDIQKEINAYLEYNPNVFKGKTVLLPCDDPEWSNFTKFFAQNFENFGLKKLISTSYAFESKNISENYQLSLFEKDSPQFDMDKTKTHGKIFVLENDTDNSGSVDIDDLKWDYLEGDGDFRSDEVKKLCSEADIIVTNPPFSLFREFFSWLFMNNKKFLIIGNINCISYKEVFIKIKENKAWLGNGMGRWISGFIVPQEYKLYGTEARIDSDGKRIISTNNCLWITNIDHGRRHCPLQLMTMADNLKFSKHKEIKENGYQKYDNYDAIEVPFTDAIPDDYEGVMGVPITFLDKYNPEQFEIIGQMANTKITEHNFGYPFVNGKKIYARILIRKKAQK